MDEKEKTIYDLKLHEEINVENKTVGEELELSKCCQAEIKYLLRGSCLHKICTNCGKLLLQ